MKQAADGLVNYAEFSDQKCKLSDEKFGSYGVNNPPRASMNACTPGECVFDQYTKCSSEVNSVYG